jgi:hypothetical protein
MPDGWEIPFESSSPGLGGGAQGGLSTRIRFHNLTKTHVFPLTDWPPRVVLQSRFFNGGHHVRRPTVGGVRDFAVSLS